MADLQISSIDILEAKDWEPLAAEIKQAVIPQIEEKLHECGGLTPAVKDFIKGRIRKKVQQATDIKPVTFFHIYQENEEN